MKEITFDLKLKVTVDKIQVVLPSGVYFTYILDQLPTEIINITNRCLLDQSNLTKSLADKIFQGSKESE